MRLPRFPPKIFKWDDYLPHLPEAKIELDRVRVKSPIGDIELKVQLESKENKT